MSDFFDELDTQEPRLRERGKYTKLVSVLRSAVQNCPGVAKQLNGIDPSDITDLAALQKIPVLRKSELMAAQAEHPPFGGFVNEQSLNGCRVFMSPGPVWEPQINMQDPWLSARALHAAGFRRGDRVHNAFSYHFTPGGFILDEGARVLGCSVFPAGIGDTEQQVTALQAFGANGFVGTPDYLNTVLKKADEMSVKLPQLSLALVSGGPLFPAMREEISQRGVRVQQCYATADFGVIAYESATGDTVHPGMVINENLIVEIVKPGSGDPVGSGEVGEILVTRLHPDYPLLRFATGDMSAFIDERSPCGRTSSRIKGWMGRADQRTKVRGMFVDPTQIQNLRKAHPEIAAVRLVVTRADDKDVMTLQFNPHPDGVASVDASAMAASLKKHTGLSGEVQLLETDLPNDGVVVDDQRELSTEH